jgi:hypothetical protein
MDTSLPVTTAVNARMVVIDKPETANHGNSSDNGAARFSRTRRPGSLSQSLAQQIIDRITSRWANAPEVVVVDSMQDTAVPKRVRDADAEQRSLGAIGEPEGFWYGGKVYVVAGSLNEPADVVRVLLHESLGHYGLRGVFGKELGQILNQIATMRRADIIAKAREYGLVREDASGNPVVDVKTATDAQVWEAMSDSHRRQAAEEVLAVMAQTKPELGFVKRAIAAIRNWLRANVPGFADMKLTDNDIVQQFILPARAWVERGARAMRTGGNAAFNRGAADQTETENFKRWFAGSQAVDADGQPQSTLESTEEQTDTAAFKAWFGDSKVVDSDGKPLVVYHGTYADFSVFDRDFLGENT